VGAVPFQLFAALKMSIINYKTVRLPLGLLPPQRLSEKSEIEKNKQVLNQHRLLFLQD